MLQQLLQTFAKKFLVSLGETLSVVAPMADVTDVALRTMIARYSKPAGPDVMWTEFVSADGLNSPG